jgi:hypothetical protein
MSFTEMSFTDMLTLTLVATDVTDANALAAADDDDGGDVTLSLLLLILHVLMSTDGDIDEQPRNWRITQSCPVLTNLRATE